MKEKIVLIGFGGHAKSVIDSIEASGEYNIAGYTDIKNRINYKGYNFIGTDRDLHNIYLDGVHNACITVGYMGSSGLRDKLYYMVKETGFKLPVIKDPSAIISNSAKIGEGTFIGKGCIVNAESMIGRMCIINTGSIIEHGNIIGDFTHIAVKTVLCGDINIGNHCFIGANSTVIQGVVIGENAVIGAGSVVINDLQSGCTSVGIPAKPVK